MYSASFNNSNKVIEISLCGKIVDYINATNSSRVNLSSMNLCSVNFNGLEVEKLDCSNNKLKKVFVPGGIKEFVCCRNNLTELTIEEGVEVINCSGNPLRFVKIPESCYCFISGNSDLDYLYIPERIRLAHVIDNPRLKEIYIQKDTCINCNSGARIGPPH